MTYVTHFVNEHVCVRFINDYLKIETNKVKKERYLRQYNIYIFNENFFLKYRTRQIKATETNYVS